MPGCGRNLSVERQPPERNALQRHVTPTSLRFYLALRALACRLRSNVDVKNKLLTWLTVISGTDCWTSRSARSEGMQRLMVVVTLCVLALAALGQSTSKYQIAIITEVKARQVAGDHASDPTSYDVSVKVGDTIYVVLYTPPLGEIPAKYATGHELLVLVGKNTITYNDILGRSLQVPIESQRAVAEHKDSK